MFFVAVLWACSFETVMNTDDDDIRLSCFERLNLSPLPDQAAGIIPRVVYWHQTRRMVMRL